MSLLCCALLSATLLSCVETHCFDDSVATGHGENNKENCAEFCPTSHHFTVNGHDHAVSFDTAGTLWGCADQVLAGSVPNEHGAWAAVAAVPPTMCCMVLPGKNKINMLYK